MGTEPIVTADGGLRIADFCREIEVYLCRKNDGHLIRVVGPSFDLVAGWAARGVPLKVAFQGIDRYFERYYRSGPRRRPVKIDFCEADVLDVFDEWRRATGVVSHESHVLSQSQGASRQSLPDHLARVITKLTSARAAGSIGDEYDPLIDRVSRELDLARSRPGGVRGEARSALVDRLAEIDRELLSTARDGLGDAVLAVLAKDADAELAPFRAGMAADAFARARENAIDRLARDRLGLPVVAFTLG